MSIDDFAQTETVEIIAQDLLFADLYAESGSVSDSIVLLNDALTLIPELNNKQYRDCFSMEYNRLINTYFAQK